MKFLEIAGSFKKGPEGDNIRESNGGRGFISHDLRILPIPFIDNDTYDGVYNEHFLEHLTRQEGIAFLQEMHRVMKPGATIRIIWPSSDTLNRIKTAPNTGDNKFVELYHTYIIKRENVFNKQYYRQFGTTQYFNTLSKHQQVAFRLLHQEGEHKYLWPINELIDCLDTIGFINAKEVPYQVSSLAEFNNIDNPQEMRPLHSTVVEAIK